MARRRVRHVRGGRDVQDFLSRKPCKRKQVQLSLVKSKRPAPKK